MSLEHAHSAAAPRALERPVRVLVSLLLGLWIAGAVIASIGVAVLAERARHHATIREAWNSGVPVVATIARRDSKLRFRANRFYLDVEYEDPTTRELRTRRARVSYFDWLEASRGASIEARAHGSIATVAGEALVARRFQVALPLLLSGVLAVLALSLAMAWRVRRQRNILTEGQPTAFRLVAMFGSERARIRYEVEGEEITTTLRVPVARHPAIERPAGDVVLLVDPRSPRSPMAARESWFASGSAEDDEARRRLGELLEEWRAAIPERATELPAAFVAAKFALEHGGLEDARKQLDRAFADGPSAARLTRKWLADRAAARRPLSAPERRAIHAITFFKKSRTRAGERASGAAALSLSIGFAIASRVLLALPLTTALVCTGILVALAYPTFLLLHRALWC
ncbi:MAG: hypothetical protein HYV07_08880 [Deltaproteobacteria bacterium]|nr:hypothetical protein [Deltaproteobacteria bacterium]